MKLVNRNCDERQPRMDVRVTTGVLEGLEGTVVAAEDDQVVVALGRGVYIVVGRRNVEALPGPTAHGRGEVLPRLEPMVKGCGSV